MKKALSILALSLMFAGSAKAVGEANDRMPRFPINTQTAQVTSTTAEQEKQDGDMQTQRRGYGYGNLCCVGYGRYCYLNGWYPIGYNCYCNDYGYVYYGYVCHY